MGGKCVKIDALPFENPLITCRFYLIFFFLIFSYFSIVLLVLFWDVKIKLVFDFLQNQIGLDL